MKFRILLSTVLSFVAWTWSLNAQPKQDLSVVTNGVLQSGFEIGLSAFGNSGDTITSLDNRGSLAIKYPGTASPGVAFITYGPSVAFGAGRSGVDVSDFQGLVVEMYGDGPASISIAIKSANQPDYGYETKVLTNVTQYPQQYYFPLSWFSGVDLKHIYVAGEFVFNANFAQNLYVRNIRFTTNGYASTKILPHVTFGGGWYTALHLSNTSGAAVEIQVNFVGTDGLPLAVPSSMLVGLTILLGPHATSVIELPNQGSFTQGYATLRLPADVVGYGLIRQSVQGQPDQQAILPFSGISAMTSTLSFDETDSVTTAAIVNIDNVDNNVLIVVRDDTGQPIGSATVALAGGNKTAIVLQNLPGLSAMARKRGSIDFSGSTGSLATLGFRFVGAAFTAIPTGDR